VIFAQPKPEMVGGECLSNISYIKAVPLTEEKLKEIQLEKPTSQTRRLIASYCLDKFTGSLGGSYITSPAKEDVMECIEPFRDSDFKIILWEGIRGDVCAYPTKIATFSIPDKATVKEPINLLSVAIEYAHEIGVELYISLRMVGASLPPVRFPIQKVPYYWRNRRFAVLDAEGNPTSHLSLAFPEVRGHWISLLREAVDYGVDGVHVIFNRSEPFVMYEKPVIESFMEKYGEDPRNLNEHDERWLRHRASYVTRFVQEIKEMVNKAERSTGRNLGISYTIHIGAPYGKPEPKHSFNFDPIKSCLFRAIDVERWIKDELVDHLIIHPISLANPESSFIVSSFKKLTKGTRVKLYPDILPRCNPAEVYLEKAIELYEAGADGFCFWDANLRHPRRSEWAMITKLGHRDQLENWRDKARGYWRSVKLKFIGGISVKYSFTDG